MTPIMTYQADIAYRYSGSQYTFLKLPLHIGGHCVYSIPVAIATISLFAHLSALCFRCGGRYCISAVRSCREYAGGR